jgi:hypothetical protein
MLACIAAKILYVCLKNCQQQFSATFHHNTHLHDGGNGIKSRFEIVPRLSSLVDAILFWILLPFHEKSSPEINFFLLFFHTAFFKRQKGMKKIHYRVKAISTCFTKIKKTFLESQNGDDFL